MTTALVAVLLALGGLPACAADAGSAARGAYLANAADCAACHTDSAHDGQPFAGGRALATRFGTFYSPNITPDAETGIGRWSDAQFLRALHDGVRPDGASYFPVFPYPSFTKMTDADALAIKAYLFSLPPVRQANRAHDVAFPLSWRFLQVGWKLLFFSAGRFQPATEHSAAYNRGAYLVTALAHCGECHTPRNWLGATEPDRFLAGNPDGPEGNKVPNITPDRKTGIGDWSEGDIVTLLETGQTRDFDFVGDGMAEVVKSTARLTEADRRAIAVYLQSVAALSTAERK
ncbi:MAG: c-type cytochrome [Alphaproteobacteria bacterium]|nr:c-type cytochrome [Alphaproteobacteria bacterium]